MPVLLRWICSPGTFSLSLSAMGRRPEIHHTQLQGEQRQPNDVPQEAVSFVCMTLCAWLLPSKCRLGDESCKCRLGDESCVHAPGSAFLASPSVLLTLEKSLTSPHRYPSCHLAGMCDAHGPKPWGMVGGRKVLELHLLSVPWVVGLGFCVPRLLISSFACLGL